MEQVKVCMLGSGGVGKTSLVARLVGQDFSTSYPSTAGVNISKHSFAFGSGGVTLILWDRSDENEVHRARSTYLRGCSGYILVADATRPETLDRAETLHAWMRQTAGALPFVLVVNKADLKAQWALPDERLDALKNQGWTIYHASARTSEGVDEAFEALARTLATS